ncbi:MAG: M20 family metallopeptidase [Methanomicrobiales archaeon]|nr:M20 family metallopeptidase [Methanomicrobiales archaeon]
MDVARLCSELVQIQSENPPGNTTEVIDFIGDYLEGIGIRGIRTRCRGGRSNLYHNSPENRLLLCGHVDVVPALAEGWTHDPASGRIEDGYVWGRGSTDMKGGVAAILRACTDIVEAGHDLPVNLAFVCDEETGGEYGIRYLLAKGLLTPCECLIAEPTPPYTPCLGQKGLSRFRVDFTGEPGHGSLYPHAGVSAIMEAFSLLEYLQELNGRVYAPPPELAPIIETSAGVLGGIFGIPGIGDALRKITFNPGRIEGGEKANIVAQKCSLVLDIRIPWGCDPEKLLAALERRAPRGRIELPKEQGAPSYTSPDAPIVRETCAEIERVYGTAAYPIVQWAASDARYLRSAGFSVVEYGPGDILRLHAIDERVGIANLERATDIYAGLIGRFSGAGNHA